MDENLIDVLKKKKKKKRKRKNVHDYMVILRLKINILRILINGSELCNYLYNVVS